MSKRKEYTTKPRTIVLDYFRQNSDITLTVSDIIKHLDEVGCSVNQTTVYRYIDKLCNDNIITKYIDVNQKKAIFQYKKDQDCDNKLHLKCTNCGKLFNMNCSFIDEFNNHLQKDHNFNLQDNGNILYGICSECKNNPNNKK